MIVEIKNLVKKYGSLTALNRLNLEVESGEIFGLLGPNGSGKTTAISCMLALLKFNEGSVKIFGKEITPESYEIKRDIGFVMQNVAVFDELTVYENIDYFCGLYINDKQKRKKLVNEAIEFTGLQDYPKFMPKKLSGGLLRRLNIACGIAHKPKLIILDEPTVAVDPQSRNHILEGIKQLNHNGATIIYTSHYMEEIEQICSDIAILDKGTVIAKGAKEQLKEMYTMGEKIVLEVFGLTGVQLMGFRSLRDVKEVVYKDNHLEIHSKQGKNNLSMILSYMDEKRIPFGKVYSELPTLNDVFLELTGKALRD